ncbi:hypothetical protein [Aeromonas sp. QDB04]|uniref:hypothetical protein n=1 Tax=Aeromonas sp. QDB04 TaxID=2990477 RepID=UPI0022E6C4C8|nr:hypothetical protein [Aeromonas sp. QDB04]
MMSFDETFSMFVAAAKAKGVDVGPHGGYQIFAEVGYQRLADMTVRATELEAQNAAMIKFIKETADVLDGLSRENMIPRLQGGAAGAASGLRKAAVSFGKAEKELS